MIDEYQRGFIRGRQAHDNTQRTLHIVDHALKNKMSTILVSIDAEKTFDQVKWQFLYKVIERYRFNRKSIQCLKTPYQMNVTSTQILTLSYTPSNEIQESFHFNWNLKKNKYLGVTITKGLYKAELYKANHDKMN